MADELVVAAAQWTPIVGAVLGKAAASAAAKFAVQRLFLLDPFNRAAETFREAIARLGPRPMHAMDEGLVTLLVRATSTADPGPYQDYWVNLIHKGLAGEIDQSNVRWAAMKLETLVPMDALALAVVLDPAPRMKRAGLSEQRGALADALARLESLDLVVHEDYGAQRAAGPPLAGEIRDAAENGGSIGLVTDIAVATGPGPARDRALLQGTWKATHFGRKLGVFADIRPLPTYGPFESASQRIDDAFLAGLDSP